MGVVEVEASGSGRPVLLVVAAVLLDARGRLLLAQRDASRALAGLWEFPGGKVAAFETPEAALVRELDEELGIEVAEEVLQPVTFASHGYDDFHLLMPLYLCRKWRGEVRAREHQALAWVRPQQLADFAMPPADEPLKAVLRERLAQSTIR